MGLVSGAPSRLQKRIFGRAVGDASLTGLMAGFQVAGIAIDNPSGSWLLVEPLNQYVPPYTMAWASPIDPPNATVEVTYPALGPGGLLSTTAGAPAVVTLYGYSVPASGGYPYIGSQQQASFVTVSVTSDQAAPTQVIPAIAGKRIRVLAIWATYDEYGQIPIIWGFYASAGVPAALLAPNAFASGTVTPSNPNLSILFPIPFDAAVGQAIWAFPYTVSTISPTINFDMFTTLEYSVI